MNLSYSSNFKNTYDNINESNNKRLNYSPYIIYNGEHRFYLKDKFPLEADVYVYFSDNLNKTVNQIADPDQKSTQTEFSNHASVPLLICNGKIERVEDAGWLFICSMTLKNITD